MRGESMKGKSKKSTYSTTFGVDPTNFGALISNFLGLAKPGAGTNLVPGTKNPSKPPFP